MNKDLTSRLLAYVFENSARNDPGSVIDAIDGYRRSHGGMIHLGAEKGEVFDQIVARSGARRVLELGTNCGYSAIRLTRSLDPAATIRTIEIDRHLSEVATALTAYAGLKGQVEVIHGQADRIIPRFTLPFDLVFIDHYPENYLGDLRSIERLGLLHEGSIVVSDNVVIFEHQLTSYLDHLRRGGGYESTLHQPAPGYDGIEASVRRGAVALAGRMA